MRALLLLLFAGLCLAQPGPDLRALVRDSLAFLDPAKNNSADYACSFRNERKQFDSSGTVKSHETVVGERSFFEGYFVSRVTERNGKRLSEEEMRTQDDLIRAHLGEIRGLSAEERERRRKKAAENEAWLQEIADALDYKYLGEESVNGRPAVVLACSPRPGYKARNMRARVFEKTNGKLWIDKADRQLVRADAEVFDTVGVGFGILGRIEKGTRFHLNRLRLEDGNWVLERQNVRFGARVMMVKYIGNEIDTRLWNHRHKTRLAER